MSVERLEDVVKRLESAVVKLESLSCRIRGGGGADDSAAEFIAPYEEFLKGPVCEFITVSAKVGPDVQDAVGLLKQGFDLTLVTLRLASVSKRPSNEQLTQLLKPLSGCIEAIKAYCATKYKSEFKSHLDAISSFCVALGWIPTIMKPHVFIHDSVDSGTFYSNRVLTSFKDKGPVHKEWVQSLTKCFKCLGEYVEEWHASGCTWNPKGGDATQAVARPAAASAAPATVPLSTAKAPTTGQAAPTMGALFSDLNKGSSVTGGLKKVDDSQKTHKNPNLRAGATVSEATTPTRAAETAKPSTAARPPLFELQGKKWIIENQQNQEMLVVETGDLSFSVNIWNCKNTNVKITPKISSIAFEGCQNCKVQIVSGLISSCDVINSKKIEVHADDMVPFVAVNKTDGCQVYLNDKSKEAKVSTSNSSSVNVCYWSPNTDLIEYPVCYQFISYIKDGKLVTEVAENV